LQFQFPEIDETFRVAGTAWMVVLADVTVGEDGTAHLQLNSDNI
jgi:hypothetical protein